MSIAELLPLIPYLMDFQDFNPIHDNLEHFYFVTEKMLEEQQISKEQVVLCPIPNIQLRVARFFLVIDPLCG
jgi:hypothetical protein